jgi:hypothetical protein
LKRLSVISIPDDIMVEQTNLVKRLFPVTPLLTVKGVGPEQKDRQKPRKKSRGRKPKDEVTLKETRSPLPSQGDEGSSEKKDRGFENQVSKSESDAKDHAFVKDRPRIDIHV